MSLKSNRIKHKLKKNNHLYDIPAKACQIFNKGYRGIIYDFKNNHHLTII